jgi:hypothetical protein
MKVYRCKICGSVKSKKNGYFNVPDKNRVKSPDHLGDPGKVRIMLHIAAAHLIREESLLEENIEFVDV